MYHYVSRLSCWSDFSFPFFLNEKMSKKSQKVKVGEYAFLDLPFLQNGVLQSLNLARSGATGTYS